MNIRLKLIGGTCTAEKTVLISYGENEKTNLQRFADQYKDVMILNLVAAAVISFVIACVGGERKNFLYLLLILPIIIVNAIMGVFQESKAEKALDALKNMSIPYARVIRNGTEKIIDASELVSGDIICLEAGDFVPADARLFHSAGLKSEESALTGEFPQIKLGRIAHCFAGGIGAIYLGRH